MVPSWEPRQFAISFGFLRLYTACYLLLVISFPVSTASSFNEEFYVSEGSGNIAIENGGQTVKLILTEDAASGFASINKYLFGSVSMQIKLVAENSAGTVTAYYLSSMTDAHDEVDFEFLGNVSGEPYILQTNVFASGIGGREMRHYLWFDPTIDFHTYSVLWNRHQIVFLIDSTPIRVFTNNEAYGVSFPNKQPMAIFSSLWNGDSWATQGGRVKIDWSASPFVASYRNFQIDACQWSSTSPVVCASPNAVDWWDEYQYQSLTAYQLRQLKWVETNYRVYDYCKDKGRYAQLPPECVHNP